MKMASLAILMPCRSRCCSAPRSRWSAPAGLAGLAQPGRARLHRDPLRLLLRRQQQRQRLRRPHAPTRRSTTLPLGLAMLFARFWLAIPVLAIAGSLARKKLVPAGPGTLPTAHARSSSSCWSASVILVGALTFLPGAGARPDRRTPADALRPAAEPRGDDREHVRPRTLVCSSPPSSRARDRATRSASSIRASSCATR